MFSRVTPLLAVVALALAACTGSTVSIAPSQPDVLPTTTHLAPVATPSPATTSLAPRATASPNSGNVEAPGAPDFSVEPASAQQIRVTLVNPGAKAWRLVVAGTASRAEDTWTLDVVTGDVGPAITTVETAAGVVGDPVDQPALELAGASGRVCSSTLPVCVIAKSVALPDGGNGTLVLDLVRTDGTAPLAVSAATAGWPSDPFVLGPWTTTEPFPWDA